ncbi:hypothetical protein CesoFtcFv8_019424 [Champsocephalus esox]|uniref:Uncharacterized protein n=1 Tax=Champsocephalus esox TaxID=159716 RepID=A0AAN8BD64_9TELE|nr:hypothetical protein CesoFtcFv8_019424 [Champsocephalus esox]
MTVPTERSAGSPVGVLHVITRPEGREARGISAQNQHPLCCWLHLLVEDLSLGIRQMLKSKCQDDGRDHEGGAVMLCVQAVWKAVFYK